MVTEKKGSARTTITVPDGVRARLIVDFPGKADATPTPVVVGAGSEQAANRIVTSPIVPADPVVAAREFAVRHSSEAVSSEEQLVYKSEAATRDLFKKHGGALAARPFETDFHTMFGISLSDDENALVNASFETMCEDGVSRPIVERWAWESGLYPTASASPEEIRERGRNAVQGVAGLAKVMGFEVNDNLEDSSQPFIFRISEEPEAVSSAPSTPPPGTGEFRPREN